MIVFPIRQYTNLGNWMFQYAAAMSLGEDVGVWFNDRQKELQFAQYEELFRGVRRVKNVNGISVYRQPNFRYSPIPKTKGDMLIDGFFQSEKFFNKELVRNRFRIGVERRNRLQEKYYEWISATGVTGISVRKGSDYAEQCHMHPFVGESYLCNAVMKMVSYGARAFIVCSDNMRWCKGFFTATRFPGLRFLFVEGESVLDQLYIHTLCQNNIISNSSFSWWGAWLNEHPKKHVIAPRKWFGPLSRYKGIDWQDIYFEGTEVVASPSPLREVVRAECKAIWLIAKMAYVATRRRVIGR